MKVEIHVLAENKALDGFLGEWGLSFHINTGKFRILFDCGMSEVAVHNARKLGLDLGRLDCVVISHGHYDHTGGLAEVLRVRRGELPVIAHPDIWQPKYAVRPGGLKKYIGIPALREELESLGARFELGREPREIFPGIITSGEVSMETGYEKIEDNLLIKNGDEFVPDPLADDQALFIKADDSTIVILGCAHRGLVNTLRQAIGITGQSKIQAAIGGTHLILADTERIEETVRDIKGFGIRNLGACHCTGSAATNILMKELGNSFFPLNSGQYLSLP